MPDVHASQEEKIIDTEFTESVPDKKEEKEELAYGILVGLSKSGKPVFQTFPDNELDLARITACARELETILDVTWHDWYQKHRSAAVAKQMGS